MRVLCCGNCQSQGLVVFLRKAMPHHEFIDLPHLATFYAEFSEAQIVEEHEKADLVFFHHKHDGDQDYPTKQPKVALPVWYQSAPFIIQAHDEQWVQVREYAERRGKEAAIEWAVKDCDMDYKKRWFSCLVKMFQKEHDDGVPDEIKMSDFMAYGFGYQLQLTCNHPTSLVFREWALRICRYMNEAVHPEFFSEAQCIAQPNLGGLPCEESATTAACKQLMLSWGGRPEDDESGRFVARQRLSDL